MIDSVPKQKPKPFVLHTRVVTGTGGGPEKTILNSPRYLRELGIDSACLFMRPPGDEGFATLETKAATAKAEIIGVDDCGPFDRNVVRECIRICKERNVTIWHAHDYKSNALGLLVRRAHKMRLVTTAHGWVRFTAKTPVYYMIDRLSMKRYDQVICVSQDLHDRCRKMRIPTERLTLIDNAIVVDDYDPSPPHQIERNRFGFDNQHIVLGAVGRLSEEKGFHHLIDAVAQLVADGRPIGLLIAGEGHLKEQLQAQIDKRGLQNNVRLVGFLSDPRDLYRAIDIFVLSSLREGLPNVVLEAMASQRAVVTTNVNGIPRLVTNGENGIVVETDSVEELYQGLEVCLESEELRQRIAAAGRRTVEEQFCFGRRMATVVDVYSKLDASLAQQIAASHAQERHMAEPAGV
ncbi:glycosyltransferase [Fuerstiella marisgermanici]|uniref:Glycosyltransferase KanE n=1 Tax=Fuerstiella marisgermanici TaxID=1891926 RepID=A0A1P8WI22_9PLAN|nr:glycosyltransferase [Fuerstiella marisgermanici]APZ93708.1 Glycosyltransferase KanE [Fuerstiella marisgermanici]